MRSSSSLRTEVEISMNDETDILQCLEKLKRHEVYSFATGEQIDQEAKALATKALLLPDTIKHLDEEND